MGMTLWIHTLQGREMSTESDDHSVMHDAAEALDALSTTLGVAPLSSFFDVTDLEFNMRDGPEAEEDDDAEVDEETGLGYGIDDMTWHEVPAGLATLRALRAHVAEHGLDGLEGDDREQLVEEFDDCIGELQGLPAGAKFHLAVIM